jgi:hypothetical protein
MEQQNPTVRVVDHFEIDPEADLDEQLVCRVDQVREGVAANDLARRGVGDTKDQMPTTLVRNRDAIGSEFLAVKTALCLLELKVLTL